MSDRRDEGPPAKKQKFDDSIKLNKDNNDIDFTEDILPVEKPLPNDLPMPEDLNKLLEYKVLDEVKSNEEDSNDGGSSDSDAKSVGLPEEEIEKMLDEDLPEGLKGAPKPINKPYFTKQKIILEDKGVNHFDVLPLDWIVVRHYSGMPVYMHRPTRVCTMSKPYFLGEGNTRHHDIPIGAIPCLAYRKALEVEAQHKEIDRRVQEQINNGTWARTHPQTNNQNNHTNTCNEQTGHTDKDTATTGQVTVVNNTAKTVPTVEKEAETVNDIGNTTVSDDDTRRYTIPTANDNGRNTESPGDDSVRNTVSEVDDSVKNTVSTAENTEMETEDIDKKPVLSLANAEIESAAILNQDVQTKCPFQLENKLLFETMINVELIKVENTNDTTEDLERTDEFTNDYQPEVLNINNTASVSSYNNPNVDINKSNNPLNRQPILNSTNTETKSSDTNLNVEGDMNDNPLNRQSVLNSSNTEINSSDTNSNVDVDKSNNPLNRTKLSDVNPNVESNMNEYSLNRQPVLSSTNTGTTSSDTNSNMDVDKSNNPLNVSNTGAKSSESNPNVVGDMSDIPLNRQPVVLPGGVVMPPPRVETVNTSWKTQHLNHEQVHEYCKNLFKFKVINIVQFSRWADRRKYTKARKTLQYPTLPEGTKLITIPAQQEIGGKTTKRDWVMNMNGRSYLSVFHEYVRRALQKQPVYEFKQLENASSPYQATVFIGGMQYGVGQGSSKRQAKSAAARASIHILIPEMKDDLEPAADAADAADAAEPDFTFFDYVGIEDPRITEFCASTCEPSPHAILRTCLLRNFGAGDTHIHTEIKKLECQNQKIELTMKVGKHSATVVCKNKKTAKQRASQTILQALHPHIRSWGSLLRLYGSRSVKSCKQRKLEEQQITLLQDQAKHNEPNRAVLAKLRQEMLKLRARDAAVVPIGSVLLPHALPAASGANLNNVDL